MGNQSVVLTACKDSSDFYCKSYIFLKRVRTVIESEEKWRVFEVWWHNVQNWREVKNGEWIVVKCTEVKWRSLVKLIIIDL